MVILTQLQDVEILKAIFYIILWEKKQHSFYIWAVYASLQNVCMK